MYASRLVTGLAVVFGGITVLFAALAIVYSIVFLAVAGVFGLSAYVVWYHASGRLARRLYRGVEAQAQSEQRTGFGRGPRADWEPPRDNRTGFGPVGDAWEATGRARTDGARRPGPSQATADSPSAREAYEALELDPAADERAVRAAYRRKVKEVHPDQPAGDEDRFKEVQAAYERLTAKRDSPR